MMAELKTLNSTGFLSFIYDLVTLISKYSMIVSIGKKSTFLITLPNIHLGNLSALEKQTIGIVRMMATFSIH